MTAAASEPEPAQPAEPTEPAESDVSTGPAAADQPTDDTQTPADDAATADVTTAPEGGAGETDGGAGEAPTAGGDGGDCGPDSAPGVGGGGGGGAPIADPQPEPEPDVSQAQPEDAMATVTTLAPGPASRVLRGVQSASDRAVAGKRDDLAANPPSRERPTGSPQTRGGGPGGPQGAAVTISKGGRADRAHARGKAPKSVPPPLPPPPPSPVQAVRPPAFTGNPQTPMTPEQAQAFIASIWRLPVTDPGLNESAGPPPTVELTGDANPDQVTEQRAKLDASVGAAATDGQQQAAAPMGEHDIYPAAKPETLRAQVPQSSRTASANAAGASARATGPGASAAGAGAKATAPGAKPAAGPGAQQSAGGGPGAGPDPVEIIAKEQSAADVQAAANDAEGQMTTSRDAQESGVDKANADAQAQIDKEVQESAKQQADQRGQALTQVAGERKGWTSEQHDKLAEHQAAADEQTGRVDTQVIAKRREANRQAAAEIDDGNKKAADAKREGEAKAEAERKKGEEESSGGVLGWIEDKARAAFNAIKSAIKAAFDWARKKIREAIDWAIEKATQLIDAARDAIVSAIHAIGDALLALGDVFLSAFPSLHERYRKKIHELVDRAVAKVDELADALKEKVKAALNALAAAIDAVLAFYEKALLAAVDLVQRAVEGAIEKARAFINMLEQWAALIADIAAAPMQWLSNLGSSALDGIRNHLWKAFKCQVKAWVSSTVQEVVGVPVELFKLLARGGIAFGQVVSMVWEGLIPAIPGILIELAIEQIVKALVPAFGAIMAIIDGLRAAWGTIKRIIAAFEKFFAFLRAVKAGNAGRQFAELLAMAAIVVLDFLSKYLIGKLIKPAKPIGGRLQALGKKIMARLSAVGKAVKRGAQKAVRAVKAGVRKAAAAVKKAAVALKQTAAKAGRTIAKVAGRVGHTVKRGARRVTAAVRKGAGRAMRVIEKRFPRVARLLKKGSGLARRVTRRVRRGWRRVKAWGRRKKQQFTRWRQRRRQERRHRLEERRRRAMERAAAELPARIHRMLQGGWPEPAMWLALRAWKLLYRLRVLTLRTSGAAAEVEAANSPPRVLVSNIVMGWKVDIGTRIRELEDEVIEDAEVKRVAHHIMDQRRRGFGSQERPIEVPPSPGGLGAARDLRLLALMEGRIPGQGRVAGGWRTSFGSRLQAGKIEEAEHLLLAPGLTPSREAAYRTLHPGSIVVAGAGRYATGVLTRPPEDPQRFMAAVQSLQRGAAPVGLEGGAPTRQAVELARLGQVEMARGGIFSESAGTELASRPPAPGLAPMLSFEERYGARQPMTREAAGRISRATRARLGLEPIPGLGGGSATEEEVRAFLHDEMGLVSRFVELQVYTQRELYDNDEAIRRYIKRHLIDHLRVVLTAMEATGGRPRAGR